MSSVLPLHVSLTHCRELGASAISPGCKASATGAVGAAPPSVLITLHLAPPPHALNRSVSPFPRCRHMQLQYLKNIAWRCSHSLHELAGMKYQSYRSAHCLSQDRQISASHKHTREHSLPQDICLAMQAAWGQCSQSWMSGSCLHSCGKC